MERHWPRRVSTRFLRVPPIDWPDVITGRKTQIRHRSYLASRFEMSQMPCPVVGYARESKRELRHVGMLVVEAFRAEPILAISPADLRREGFDDLSEYRRYWRAHRNGFRPMDEVYVYDVRPMGEDEVADFAGSIFRHLYGPWLDEAW